MKINDFVTNGIDAVKKNVGKAAIFGSFLMGGLNADVAAQSRPTTADTLPGAKTYEQIMGKPRNNYKATDFLDDGSIKGYTSDQAKNRLLAISMGVSVSPENVGFDTHITTNIIRDIVHGEAGATLTGKSIGASGFINARDYRSRWQWAHRFNTVYLGLDVGKRVDFNKEQPGSYVRVKAGYKARFFPGGGNNVIPWNDHNVNIGAEVFFGVPLARRPSRPSTPDVDRKKHWGLKVSAEYTPWTLHNRGLGDYFRQNFGIASDRAVSPALELKVAVMRRD